MFPSVLHTLIAYIHYEILSNDLCIFGFCRCCHRRVLQRFGFPFRTWVCHVLGSRTDCCAGCCLIQQNIALHLVCCITKGAEQTVRVFSFSRVLSPFCVLHYKGRRTNCRNHSHLAEYYFPFSLLHRKWIELMKG